MFDYIHADTLHACRREKAFRARDMPRLLWTNYGLQTLVIYRFGRWLGQMRQHPRGWVIAFLLQPIYRLMALLVRKAYGINLEQSAEIAPGLAIGHFGGVEVKNCRIGPNCYIGQQVRLEPTHDAGRRLLIGERVWIGAHARICAAVSIGDRATIGTGAVVTQDVPDDCLVLGNPARIAQRGYDNSVFL